jgi:hypothetical protein
MFRDVWDKDCLTVVPISSILNGIKNGIWKESIAKIRSLESKEEISRAKHHLPSVTFSGVFEDTREDDNIVLYNKLMVVDIDKISDKRLTAFKEELKKDKYVLTFFNGPTKGVKLLMNVDTDCEDHSTYAFSAVKYYFDEMYKIEIDPSGKNVSRLCFVSYDPDLYVNPEPFVFPVIRSIYDEENNQGYVKADTFNPKNLEQTTNGKKILDTSVKMVRASKTGGYHKGNRNNFIFSLACLMSDFGVPLELSCFLIYERYNSLEYKEVKNTIHSAYRKVHYNHGSRTLNVRGKNNGQAGFF